MNYFQLVEWSKLVELREQVRKIGRECPEVAGHCSGLERVFTMKIAVLEGTAGETSHQTRWGVR